VIGWDDAPESRPTALTKVTNFLEYERMNDSRVGRKISSPKLAQTLQIITAILLPAFSVYALIVFSDKPDSLVRQAGLLIGALSIIVFAILMFQHVRITALEKVVADLQEGKPAAE